jgi:peroxiredoxin
MAYANLNLLYDCEFSVPEDANGNEVRNLDGWEIIDSSMSSYNLRSKLENQKVVMFSTVGTFRNPTKVLNFNSRAQELTALGVDRIICHIVADDFQTYAWAAHLNVPNIEFIADGNGYLATRLGMLYDASPDELGNRCWSYSSVVDNGVVSYWQQELGLPMDGPGNGNINVDAYAVTGPENLINYLQQN